MKPHLLGPKFNYLKTVFLPLVLLSLIVVMGISGAAAQDVPPPSTPTQTPKTGDSNPGLVASLAQNGAQIAYHDETGAASFITTTPGRPIAQPSALRGGGTKEDAARGFLAAYGPLFGLRDQSTELVRKTEKKPDAARTFERFQQVYNGVPVIGGELIVQVDSSNNVLSANGEVLPRITLSTTPTITAAAAAQSALNLVAKYHRVQASDLVVSTPVLSIYNPILISPNSGDTQLVWRMEVTPKNLAPIREFVLIDAQRGGIALHFNQIDNVLSRQTYTANNGSSLPGVLVCNESNPTCSNGDAEAKGAHINAGITYNFYFDHFGRNSINNAGMVLKSTVHFRDPLDPYQPYNNAFWNGIQMVYGDANSYAQADDVVGHELTHGVTENEAGLFYYYQSGAINESLSDVFGEFVDQTDGVGNDTAGVKWDIGEDALPTGALRSMSFPTDFGDPDRMTSSNYWPYPTDRGGVHTNSGINNKAAYLMTDGGSFNGRTVTALGIDKVAKIYYEAQTNLLTSGSDYGDLYNALYQACYNVLGGSLGITLADCQEVRDATNAVEMNLQPNFVGFNAEAPLCPAGQNPDMVVFSDDMEGGASNWSFGGGHWRYDSPYGSYAHSGSHFLYADDFPAQISSSYAATKSSFTLPTNAYLRFAHAYGFEGSNYDGGVVEYSNDNGSSWQSAGGLFDTNGYTGTISSSFGNPLGGQAGFVADSFGYTASRLNLSSLQGQSVRFRWRMGLDYSGYDWGWWLDDVMIYNCGTPPSNDNFASPTTISVPDGIQQSNGAASVELVEQKATCEGAANIKSTLWYQYTASANQKVTFSVTNVVTASAVVKGISVWTGSTIGALTQVGCGTPGVNASAVVNVTNGTTYYIRVGTKNGVGDNLTIQTALLTTNDDFANAIAINTGFDPFSDIRDVAGASIETGEPVATCGGAAFRTVWYKYTSFGSTTLSINTDSSSYDTVLSVWTGAGPGALTQVASGCNDNTLTDITSALTLNVAPGVIYYIRVGSKGGSAASLHFNAAVTSTANVAPLRNVFTTGTPTLTWNRVTNATQYEIQVSKASTFTPLVFPAVLVPASQLSITIGTDTPAPLPEGIYYWRVRVIRGATAGAWSAVDSFIVDLP